MKREIKFKCWDKKLNKWVNIFTHKIGVQLTDVGFAVSTGYDSYDDPTWDFSKVEFDRYEFPQFTGKYDKNGDEIYEGDIIEFDATEWGDNETNIHVITWNDTSAEWSWGGGSTSDMEWRKVIGNIYENPELI